MCVCAANEDCQTLCVEVSGWGGQGLDYMPRQVVHSIGRRRRLTLCPRVTQHLRLCALVLLSYARTRFDVMTVQDGQERDKQITRVFETWSNFKCSPTAACQATVVAWLYSRL